MGLNNQNWFISIGPPFVSLNNTQLKRDATKSKREKTFALVIASNKKQLCRRSVTDRDACKKLKN
jgi:hypothetical protein